MGSEAIAFNSATDTEFPIPILKIFTPNFRSAFAGPNGLIPFEKPSVSNNKTFGMSGKKVNVKVNTGAEN